VGVGEKSLDNHVIIPTEIYNPVIELSEGARLGGDLLNEAVRQIWALCLNIRVRWELFRRMTLRSESE